MCSRRFSVEHDAFVSEHNTHAENTTWLSSHGTCVSSLRRDGGDVDYELAETGLGSSSSGLFETTAIDVSSTLWSSRKDDPQGPRQARCGSERFGFELRSAASSCAWCLRHVEFVDHHLARPRARRRSQLQLRSHQEGSGDFQSGWQLPVQDDRDRVSAPLPRTIVFHR